MQRIKQRKSIICILLALGCLASGCSDDGAAGTEEQRNLGDIALHSGLSFSLRPGTIDQFTQNSVEARASVPLPQFSLSAGPMPAEQVRITLANIHRDATVRVLREAPLTTRSRSNCPNETSREAIECASTPEHPSCAAPELTRAEGIRSEATLLVDLDACTRRSYTVERGDADAAGSDMVRLAVLGRAASLDELGRALDAATADSPDFVLLLGDAAENSSLNGLRDLDFLLRRVDFPAVMLPGEDELVDGKRARFLEVFGPFDFGWQVGDAQFYAFYSADATLSDDGLSRLRNVLGRMQSNHPTLLFTHTPPTDPLGPRDQGFRSQLQAARVLSLLSESTIDAFFVGHINDRATEDINSIKMYLTSVERSQEYLSVHINGDEINVTRETF
ncbi:metallophosphoesterase family protein [Bradymonas sediminis]|uniref:Uncharacterized protein n=1 Tax=Bradymonas sediminis TaxID=1548548 RepID=A0A2Z4FKJ8_9DELT|nr:metallophosphoesterase [Bradymonas sediminis]AWV89501.1 hypothetical protein DN745_09170 [Bradymonas sediminis]TDP76771.1 calcineurin-like phosphoesterase family protein [Bradymonas sediminis]